MPWLTRMEAVVERPVVESLDGWNMLEDMTRGTELHFGFLDRLLR